MANNFDLDVWIRLAEEDLDAFEEQRAKFLHQVIEAGYDKRQLNGLQFRINMERRRAKNPIDSCIRLSKMMNEKFFDEFFPAFGNYEKDLEAASREAASRESVQSADIIPFKPCH